MGEGMSPQNFFCLCKRKIFELWDGPAVISAIAFRIMVPPIPPHPPFILPSSPLTSLSRSPTILIRSYLTTFKMPSELARHVFSRPAPPSIAFAS